MTPTEHDAAVRKAAFDAISLHYESDLDYDAFRNALNKAYDAGAIAALATTRPSEDSGEVAREEQILELGGMVDSLETECADRLAEVARLREALEVIANGPYTHDCDALLKTQVARAALKPKAGDL